MTFTLAATIIWVAFAIALSSILGLIIFTYKLCADNFKNNRQIIDYDAMLDGGTYVEWPEGEVRFENYSEEMFRGGGKFGGVNTNK